MRFFFFFFGGWGRERVGIVHEEAHVPPSLRPPPPHFFLFVCLLFFFPPGRRTAGTAFAAPRIEIHTSGGEKGADGEISGEAGEGRRVRKCERSGMTESEIETQTFAEPRVPPLRPPMGGGDRREREPSAAWRSGLLLVKY